MLASQTLGEQQQVVGVLTLAQIAQVYQQMKALNVRELSELIKPEAISV